eukprot:1137210-Pelagomonas_calceolata.AAC.3
MICALSAGSQPAHRANSNTSISANSIHLRSGSCSQAASVTCSLFLVVADSSIELLQPHQDMAVISVSTVHCICAKSANYSSLIFQVSTHAHLEPDASLLPLLATQLLSLNAHILSAITRATNA